MIPQWSKPVTSAYGWCLWASVARCANLTSKPTSQSASSKTWLTWCSTMGSRVTYRPANWLSSTSTKIWSSFSARFGSRLCAGFQGPTTYLETCFQSKMWPYPLYSALWRITTRLLTWKDWNLWDRVNLKTTSGAVNLTSVYSGSWFSTVFGKARSYFGSPFSATTKSQSLWTERWLISMWVDCLLFAWLWWW